MGRLFHKGTASFVFKRLIFIDKLCKACRLARAQVIIIRLPMKKIFTIAFIAMLSVAHAQRVAGIRGGLNISNITNTNAGGIDESRNLQTFHAGFMANFPFLIFSFQPSLIVTGKGSQVTYGDPNSQNYFVAKSNPFYIEVPATFNLNLHFGDRNGVYVGAGPYVAAGFAGKNSVSGMRDGVYFNHSDAIDFANDDPATPAEEGAAYGKFRRYDYGVTANAGVFLGGIMVGVFYDAGMAKINSMSNSNQNDNLKNRTLGFTAGFVFGG